MVTERRRKKMKDFFEELGKYIGETATTVGNKAGEVIETQKLKSQVRSLTHENTVDLLELGRGVYEQYKSGALQNLRRRSQLSEEQENARIVERW